MTLETMNIILGFHGPLYNFYMSSALSTKAGWPTFTEMWHSSLNNTFLKKNSLFLEYIFAQFSLEIFIFLFRNYLLLGFFNCSCLNFFIQFTQKVCSKWFWAFGKFFLPFCKLWLFQEGLISRALTLLLAFYSLPVLTCFCIIEWIVDRGTASFLLKVYKKTIFYITRCFSYRIPIWIGENYSIFETLW